MREKLASIQYLRAIAALIVVFHHARNPHPWLYNSLNGVGAGQAGVDIFFVISGFIMYAAARNEPVGVFFRRRIIRIVPLYWLATVVTFLLAAHSHIWQGLLRYNTDMLKSLFFIPYYNDEHDGNIWPFLVPGWTLNYEIFFYLVFGIGIATRRIVPLVSGVLFTLIALGLMVSWHEALWETYTDPLLSEFLAGIFIARYRSRLSSFWLAALLPVGILAIGLSDLLEGPRIILWGLPAIAVLIGALAIEDAGWLPRMPWLERLGDASFSIYLFQIVSIAMATKIVRALPLHGPLQLATMITGCMVLSVAAGLLAHRLFERPLTRLLLRRRTVLSV